jgi:hypothetical protein
VGVQRTRVVVLRAERAQRLGDRHARRGQAQRRGRLELGRAEAEMGRQAGRRFAVRAGLVLVAPAPVAPPPRH